MSFTARFGNALAAVVLSLCITGTARSQEDPVNLLNNYIHYSLVANVELASANGQKLLDSGITNAELATLIDDGKVETERFERAIARSQLVPELEGVAAEIANRAELGRRDLARDQKRIEEAIKMLTGVQRAKLLGRQRLVSAGEYAVPSLLKEISDGRDQQVKIACQDVMIQIGRQAVYPLCVALPGLTGGTQRVVCDMLGQIKIPSAAPYLKEVSEDQNADQPARDAAARAFTAIGGGAGSVSKLYADLARDYFDAYESMVAFPAEPTNNVWTYSSITGLSPTPVPTEIFTEVLAVKTSSRAIALDAANIPAISLFVASNLKRENDLPEGAADPVYGESKYTPDFYATVFGTQTCLDVLGMAVDKRDTPLVRDAIGALAKTTGGANLFARSGGRNPLLEALSYPDRRVQYDAALTLARALPQEKYSGDQAIVPILASAVRMGNQSLALLVADDAESRAASASELEKLGFRVVAQGGNVTEAQPDINRAVGVDLVVVRMNDFNDALQVIESLRAIPKTTAAPTLVLAAAVDAAKLNEQYRDDPRISAGRITSNPEEFTASVDFIMNRAAGGRITEAEAEEYAIRSLSALRDVAISRSPAYTIRDAESALIDAIDHRSGGTRLLVADILALIDNDDAQRKLFDAALNAADDEQIELLRRVSDSVRIFGDRAEDRHVASILELVEKSSGATAEAAATVHGALNLPASDAVKLLPQ